MAEIKRTVPVKPVVKETIKAEAAEKPMAAVTVSEKAAAKAPEKKEEVKAEGKPAAKKSAKAAAKPAAKKTAAKKPAVKETAKPVVKKAAAKQVINLQFSGKSYSMEDLSKIAGDVWKYDLHKSDEAYESLELYVKPEESVAYYVFNGDITGSFFI